MFLPVAYSTFEPDHANTVACLLLFFTPATVSGVYGILAAFRGKRRAALRAGWCAGVPAALYYVVLGVDLFAGWGVGGAGFDLFVLLACGSVPFTAACWAILLAYLVPESPPDRPPADVPPESVEVPR